MMILFASMLTLALGLAGDFDDPDSSEPIRLAGQWSGQFANSKGQKGEDSLKLFNSGDGDLAGTWDGFIKLTGTRVGRDTFIFEATHPSRGSYKAAGRIVDNTMILKYVCSPPNGGKKYYGVSTLQRGKD